MGEKVTHTRETKDGNQCMTRSRREHAYADKHTYTTSLRLEWLFSAIDEERKKPM